MIDCDAVVPNSEQILSRRRRPQRLQWRRQQLARQVLAKVRFVSTSMGITEGITAPSSRWALSSNAVAVLWHGMYWYRLWHHTCTGAVLHMRVRASRSRAMALGLKRGRRRCLTWCAPGEVFLESKAGAPSARHANFIPTRAVLLDDIHLLRNTLQIHPPRPPSAGACVAALGEPFPGPAV